MATRKYYQVIAWSTYRDGTSHTYVCGEYTTKREARECLARQYDTPSRSHFIKEIRK